MSSNSFIRLALSLLVGLLILVGTAACAVPSSPLSEEAETTPSQATVLDVKFKIVIAPNEIDAPLTTMAAPSELDAPLTTTAAHSELDAPLRTLIAHNELTGDPSIGRDLPDIEDPLAQLGMMLFFTKALSGTGDTACVSCHHPALGGGDAVLLSTGVDANEPHLLGPGRSHPEGPMVPRNAPTTFNIGMWDQYMFWDGRVESLGKTPGKNGGDGYGIRTPDSVLGEHDPRAGDNLAEAQSRFPVTSDVEMRGLDFGVEAGSTMIEQNERIRELLAQRIGDYGEGQGVLPSNNWLVEFQTAFNSDQSSEDLITFENIAKTIGEYERSQVFVDTPWKAYVQGDDDAINEAAKRGAILFYGDANCSTCHSGDFFTDENFHALAIPQIGVGKASGMNEGDDFGRYLETKNTADKYAFRTPTLLNVEVTGPYGHDGAYDTLEGIVRHNLNPIEAAEHYDFSTLEPSVPSTNAEQHTQNALEKFRDNREQGRSSFSGIALNDAQIDDLVAFLLTLTDPCVKDRECLAPWIPGESVPDPDGQRLDAVDAYQNPL